ncbi:MAG: hypothetical protein AAFR87_00175 [Bacteroidota bacterium]
MKSTPVSNNIFSRFSISPQRGFLPDYTPIHSLGSPFEAWDELANGLPQLISGQKVKASLASLSEFPLQLLQSPNEKERAMLILAHLASAYVWETGEMRDHIPAVVAIPFAQLADELGRPAIVHHMTNVMYNWRKKDPNGALIGENMEALISFNDSPQEAWFYNVTAEIESVGAPALQEMILIHEKGRTLGAEDLHTSLQKLHNILIDMNRSLNKMVENLDPEFFYHNIRPYLSSFVNIKFEGVQNNHVRSYAGGSAAQSSLIQAFDVLMGITHPHGSGKYLLAMRDHMPPAHKAFLEWMEEGKNLADIIPDFPKAKDIYQMLVDALLDFRNTHLKIVATFIAGPAQRSGKSSEGTGGTDALSFLKEVRNDMKKHKE